MCIRTLERRRLLNHQPGTTHWMHERQSFRMQLHPFLFARRIVAIEAIAGNRRVEPLRVRRVHAKLV